MRLYTTTVLALAALLATAAAAVARPVHAVRAASVRALTAGLVSGMRQAGAFSGAEVVDLTTGQTLYTDNATVGRLPASVQKLYTTSTALLRFGADATLTTSVLGVGTQRGGTFTGTLYLRGGGDPTFGSAAFDRANYGTGASVQQLVSNLVGATGITRLKGTIVADETLFDADRGTPATGNQPSIWVEGELSGLSFNRGWADSTGQVYWAHPALEAGQQFAAALQADGVRLGAHPSISAGTTPAGATPLAGVTSPPMSSLIALTNAPSDNFFAETLLKDLGVRFGAGGTTAAGIGVVSGEVASAFGLHPRFNDGSGLSYYDRTTPQQVVTLLRDMAGNRTFTDSLAVAGRTGTLQDEMRNTYAQGRCQGKTGTLASVSNLVGYCHAQDGHTLAFALLMNGVDPLAAHPIQDRMIVSIARYDG
jgi:D-alanyl-D-alanine carboxypeptidase/D-alanyl-D-alanine-endopeptidase (penicillin-binding protein 4)